ILDANLTTILAALVLFVFGESSVKGFATMLLLAILMSFVTSVFFTRILLGLLVNSNYFKKKYNWFGVSKKDRHDISERLDVHDLRTVYDKINFVKLAKPLLTFSIITIIVGAIIVSIFRLNLGIDFTSG